jgi:hypothetical protein
MSFFQITAEQMEVTQDPISEQMDQQSQVESTLTPIAS